MEIKAQLNYLHIAPRKVRLAADLIKGKSAVQAETILKHLSKRSAEPLLKLLKSAIANARHNFHEEKENLMVKSVRVDAGPIMKRFMPRARGMASPIRRRQSHVSLVLQTKN